MAGSDYLLKLDGVEGDMADGSVRVESFSWGVSNAAASSGSGGGAGKVSFSSFNFVKRFDKASPQLARICATGEHIKSASLSKFSERRQRWFIYKMTDILISSYNIGHAVGGGDVPTESISMKIFPKVEIHIHDVAG